MAKTPPFRSVNNTVIDLAKLYARDETGVELVSNERQKAPAISRRQSQKSMEANSIDLLRFEEWVSTLLRGLVCMRTLV